MVLQELLKKNFEEEGIDIEETWINMLNNLHDIVVYQDLERKIIWGNETAMEEFAESFDKIQGRHCYELVHNRSEPCEDCLIEKAEETGKVVEGEKINPSGNLYFVRAYPVKNKEDEVKGIIRISLNITKRRALKERLEQNKLRTELFANLSHELKTPLNLIFSGIQLLELNFEKNEDEDKYIKYLNAIKQNTNRLLKLVENLVDINKLDTRAYDLSFENCDIVSLIKKVFFSVKEYAESKERELEFDSEIKEKVIACDPLNIERVILNLFSNAIKFTDKGDRISMYLSDEGDNISISVRDTGVGIPKDKQEIIFERFGRVDKSFTRNNEGSGIGLSLVKMIIERHGGEIDLESEYGKGSEFIIKLPAQKLSQEDDEKYKIEIQDSIIDKINVEFSDIYC